MNTYLEPGLSMPGSNSGISRFDMRLCPDEIIEEVFPGVELRRGARGVGTPPAALTILRNCARDIVEERRVDTGEVLKTEIWPGKRKEAEAHGGIPHHARSAAGMRTPPHTSVQPSPDVAPAESRSLGPTPAPHGPPLTFSGPPQAESSGSGRRSRCRAAPPKLEVG